MPAGTHGSFVLVIGWSDLRTRVSATGLSVLEPAVALRSRLRRRWVDLFLADVNGIGHWWFVPDWQTTKENCSTLGNAGAFATSTQGGGRIDLRSADGFELGLKLFDPAGGAG